MRYSFAKRLKLSTRTVADISVNGIGDSAPGHVCDIITCHSSPVLSNDHSVTVEAFLMERVTSMIPSENVNLEHYSKLMNLPLADMCLQRPSEIDLLLDADVYTYLLPEDTDVKRFSGLCAQKTIFGYVLIGEVSNVDSEVASVCSHYASVETTTSTDYLLKCFWEIENIPSTAALSQEEKICENHFEETTVRNSDGRYTVSLPFRDGTTLGESRTQAVNRQKALERRLDYNPQLKQEYCKTVTEYIELGHAELVNNVLKDSCDVYYLPHHCVLKESSTTTKLRVVFDASAKRYSKNA
ncbi:uncharacterized protein LOC141909044 [Tubulanus polymorphus]|uniref:uncharacterized protein LOC141909044 n=1 Tax=Tubulanus polymorphus TaxID=672921 RepID=UPI003DA1CF81